MTVESENQPPLRNAALRSADEVLLDSELPSLLVCSIFEDQRPLKGVAGALDWRLKGFLSRFVMNGHITGAHDEFVYVPIKHQGDVRHLMLVGLGAERGRRQSEVMLANLAQRVCAMNFKRVAVSRSSFPFLDESRIKKALKGVEVEITQ
ncbi:MAG: hypothetical protein HY074_00095 [Deltaproteobacteria bacterium]|nr:hypothetical protein [Deltaproteobacteria bacterium]